MEVEILFSATQAITRRLFERRAPLIANISIRLIEKRRKKGLGTGRGKVLFFLFCLAKTDLVFPIDSNRNGKIAAALGE
jgi:hypothetical protein